MSSLFNQFMLALKYNFSISNSAITFGYLSKNSKRIKKLMSIVDSKSRSAIKVILIERIIRALFLGIFIGIIRRILLIIKSRKFEKSIVEMPKDFQVGIKYKGKLIKFYSKKDYSYYKDFHKEALSEIFVDDVYNKHVDVNKGDVVLDCGSNLGMFSVYSAINQASKIYAFEPDDFMNKYLKFNIKLNLLNNVFPVKLGVYDKEETLYFKSDQNMSKVVDKNEKYDFMIKTTTIDALVKRNNISKVNFIKMDIEGSEIPALLGAKDTIKKYKPECAICIYHKPFDFVEIPLLLKHLNPNYKIYIGKSKINRVWVVYAL